MEGLIDLRRPHVVVVCLPALRWFQESPFRLSPSHVRSEDCRYSSRDLVLKRKDILDVSVVALGPKMIAAFGADELRRDAYAVPGSPDAAFQDVSNSQVAPDMTGID